MNTINAAFHNYVLMSAIIAWLIAQVMKTTVTFIKLKRFEPERLVGAGECPAPIRQPYARSPSPFPGWKV